MSGIKKIKGFADLFQPESGIFTYMEATARMLFGCYGYEELRIPIIERTELFSRSIGFETDIVQKEMYTFLDRKERSITLRPEATAGIIRAYIENKKYIQQDVTKLCSIGPMFRYERPQKGRMRQFHQINCECLGHIDSYTDAELIIMLIRFLESLDIRKFTLQLNSLGCKICRPPYKTILLTWLNQIDPMLLCDDCRRRKETNPIRIFDCKVPSCKHIMKDAPSLFANQCVDCSEYFSTVIRLLDHEEITYEINPHLVRGLDYYTRTTFEVVSTDIGSQCAIAGGGHYDGLIEQLGGPMLSGIGFACGMERLALLIPEREKPRLDVIVAALEEPAKDIAFSLALELRDAGLKSEWLFKTGSMKSLMRHVDKSRALYCLLLGSEELAVGEISIKNMDKNCQQQVPLADVITYILKDKEVH